MNAYLRLMTLGLLYSCSQSQTTKSTQIEEVPFCQEPQHIEQRHLALGVRSKQKSFNNCVQNFMKFEANKNQTIQYCIKVNSSRGGDPIAVKVLPYSSVSISPKSLAMCIEQEIWQMNFKGLQLHSRTQSYFSVKILTSGT